MGNTTGISAFWIVFSTTFFGGLWGFVGMVVGVPLMAIVQYIVSRILNYLLKRKGIPTDTESYIKLRKIDKYTNEPIYGKAEKKPDESASLE